MNSQPNSVLGGLGGDTPQHGHGPASNLTFASHGGPSSVLGPASIIRGRSDSIGGPGSMMLGSQTNSHMMSNIASMSMSLMGGGFTPQTNERLGGPSSNLNFGQLSQANLNINPPSVNAIGPGSIYQDMNPQSVGNLAVPMTPLNVNDQQLFREMVQNKQQNPQSVMQMQMPQTPASLDIPSPTLQNIVSTVNLGVPLDLKKIALHARNAEYNPKRFAAVIMRIREPRTTALIFSSGKMVCTGAKSEEASRLAARKYARIVQKLGFEAKFTEFKVQNMVGSCDVRFPIQLEGLCITHAQFSTYEPELFPGLIYRMVKPRVVLLIFVSGKVVITGAKFKKDIDDAFSQIYPILKGFKK
ncbi:unnamed protein product, partial [Mesorhabditis belari]|uniref:TATA-box-binding protein n=1 Tax=Mesorhabditis belari TaxID=2138241 RepID=A0AAF3F093_9BILA